jgi:hypothetical protein
VTLRAAADLALAAMVRAMDGTSSSQRANLALTLHMLEFLAPAFFAEHRLAARSAEAMRALQQMPASFDKTLDVSEAMARLDGLYVCAVRGVAVQAFDRRALQRAIARSEAQGGPLWRWLMAALAARLGVADDGFALEGRWPFQTNPTVHLYHLTHLVLIATEYLRTPVPAGLADELGELEAALPRLIGAAQWDLLAECVMCLHRAGVPARPGVEALVAAQNADGSLVETAASTQAAAHCTAAGLLALAGALDLERSAP